MFDRLRSLFRGKVPENYEGSVGWDVLSGWEKGNGRGASSVFTPMEAADLEAAYKQNSVVRSCIEFLATSSLDPRLEIGVWTGQGQDREWEVVPTRLPIMDALERPTSNTGYSSFVSHYIMALLSTGVSATMKRRGEGRQIVQLWSRPTSWVTMIPGRGDQMFRGFKVKPSEKVIPAEDMMLSMLPDPQNPAAGCGPLESCARDYLLDVERENYIAEMLVNADVPGLKIFTERPIGDKEVKRLEEKLAERAGPKRRGKSLIIQGGGKGSRIDDSVPLSDLDWPGLSNLEEARICAAFGVSPILLGQRVGMEHATYANYPMAEKACYNNTLRPLWGFIASEWTRGLFRDEGEPQLEFRFRYDELPQFTEDATAVVERTVKKLQAGIIDEAEARAECGHEPLTDAQIQERAEADAARLALAQAALGAQEDKEDVGDEGNKKDGEDE